MKWSTVTAFSVLLGPVLGVPVAPTSAGLDIPPHVRDQGDGFYTANYNEAGGLDVTFTPIAQLPVANTLVVRDVNTPRDGPTTTVCGGTSDNSNDLDIANVQLANNAPNKKTSLPYGWVHINGQTSYWCNYETNLLTFDVVMGIHVALSENCGGRAAYGYMRRVNQGKIRNLSVGRTFTGDHFCTKTFHGHEDLSATESSTAPADLVTEKSIASSKVPQVSVRDVAPENKAAPWSMSSDMGAQEDGLYINTWNEETGKLDIKFTPIAELNDDVEPDVPATPGFTAENSNPLHKRGDKITCSSRLSRNVPDLDWANIQLAKAADHADLKKSPRGWIHHGGETSYWCAYSVVNGYNEPYANFIAAQVRVSAGCKGGSAAYGYDRFEGYTVTPPGEATAQSNWTNLSVGRTYKGDAICSSNFYPPSAANAGPVEPSRRTAVFDPQNQGDGFYMETFNELGESTIKFTPKAELTTAGNPAVKRTGTLQQRKNKQTCSHAYPKLSNNWQDLDEANIALAHGVNGVHHPARTRSWLLIGKEISYICAYGAWDGSYNQVIDANIRVSGHCKGASRAYGYDYDNVANLSIGRTFAGGHICRWDTLPAAAPNVTDLAPVTEREVAESFDPSSRSKKKESQCSKRKKSRSTNTPDLDKANIELANELHLFRLKKNSRHTVVIGDERSYVCAYKDITLIRDDIIAAQIRVSQLCGGSDGYGYDYNMFLDLSIGRTYKSDRYCR